jgi:hypothetical protein
MQTSIVFNHDKHAYRLAQDQQAAAATGSGAAGSGHNVDERTSCLGCAEAVPLWTVPLEEQGGRLKAGKPEQFLKTNFVDQAPSFSPDGKWLAYHSNESGTNEVYVRAFPPPASRQGGKWQISNFGGTEPRWSHNGHDLIYRSGDQIMTASYTVKGDTFVSEKPRVWIAKLGGTQWDLSSDGRRVAVLMPMESEEAPKQEHEIVMLLNFFDELRRKVPLGK